MRAIAIREKVLGPNHPELGLSLNNLAEVYRLLARYSEAEPLYKRAIDIAEKALGPQHPTLALMLGNLALIHFQLGRNAEAEPLCGARSKFARRPWVRTTPTSGSLLPTLPASISALAVFPRPKR